MAAVPLPLAVPLTSRDGTLSRDSLIMNGFISPSANGGMNVHKRPGFTFQYTHSTTQGQGIFKSGVNTYEIKDFKLYVNGGGAYPIVAHTTNHYHFSSTGNLTSPELVVFSAEGTNLIYVWNGTTLTPNALINITGGLLPGICQLDGTFYVMDTSGQIWGSPILNPSGVWSALNLIQAPIETGSAAGLVRHRDHLVAFGSDILSVFYDVGNATGSPLQQATSYFQHTGCAYGRSIAVMDDVIYWVSQADTGYIRIYAMDGVSPKEISTPDVCRVLNLYGTLGSGIGVAIADRSLYIIQLTGSLGYLAYDIKMAHWYFWTLVTVYQTLSATTFTQDASDPQLYTCAFSQAFDLETFPYVGIAVNGGSVQFVPVASWADELLHIRFPYNDYGASMTANVDVYRPQGAITSWTLSAMQTSTSQKVTLNTLGIDRFIATDNSHTDSPIFFQVRTQDNDLGTEDLKSNSYLDIIGDRSGSTIYVRVSDDDGLTYMGWLEYLTNARIRVQDIGSFERRSYTICNLDSTNVRVSRADVVVKTE